jgi:hypothetical protein
VKNEERLGAQCNDAFDITMIDILTATIPASFSGKLTRGQP